MTEVPVVQPEIHDDRSTDERIQAAANSHVNVVRVDLGGITLMVVVFFGIIIAGCGIVIGLDIAERTSVQHAFENEQRAFENEQRAWRMAELKYDELNLTLQRAGLVLPGDYRRGVTGNTQPKERK